MRRAAALAILATVLPGAGCSYITIAAGITFGLTGGSSGSHVILAPTIASIVPSSAPHSGGTTVTLSGANFAPGATVIFGSAVATIASGATLGEIMVQAPSSQTIGSVNVTLSNPGGGSVTQVNGFTYTDALPVATMAPLQQQQSGNVVLSITVADAEGDPADLELDVNTGNGFVPIPAFALVGGTTGLATSAQGIVHTVAWDSQTTFPFQNFASVTIRAIPTEILTGKTGTPATTNVFSIGNDTPPLLQAITPTDDAFDVVFHYQIADPNRSAQVSVTSLAWQEQGTGSSGPMTIKSGQGTGGAPSSPLGVLEGTVWDSFADLGFGNNHLVQLSVAVTDGVTNAQAITAPFFVNNGPLADEVIFNAFNHIDGDAVGDVNSDGLPDVVIASAGRLGVSTNEGQSFNTLVDVVVPNLSGPAFLFGNNLQNPQPKLSETAILDVNGDGLNDIVAADDFFGPYTLQPLLQNAGNALTQAGTDAPDGFLDVVAHQTMFVVLQSNANTLDIAAATTATIQAFLSNLATTFSLSPVQVSPTPTSPVGDLSHDEVGWFVQKMVAASLAPPGSPTAGQKDLVVLTGFAQLDQALFSAATVGVPTSGGITIQPVDPVTHQLDAPYYLDPTDMGLLPTDCAVGDVLSSSRLTAPFTTLASSASVTPVQGSADIVVANTGDMSLTFYFQIAPSPGVNGLPVWASLNLPLWPILGLSSPVQGDTVGVAIGDLNGDHANDILVVGSLTKTALILLYDPNPNDPGSLLGQTSGALPFRVSQVIELPEILSGRPAIADVNGDGKGDLLIPSTFTNNLLLYVNRGNDAQGNPIFGPPPSQTPQDLRFTANFEPFEVKVADLNGDGRPDAVAFNSLSQDFSVFYQTAQGTLGHFIPIPSGTTPFILDVGDVTGGGQPDLVCTLNGANGVLVYARDPVATLSVIASYDCAFSPPVPDAVQASLPFFPKIVSGLSGPGSTDILVSMELVIQGQTANSSNDPQVFSPDPTDPSPDPNPGDLIGGFEVIRGCPLAAGVAAIVTSDFGTPGFDVAVGDLNRDGIPDAAFVNQGNGITIYYQNAPAGSLSFTRHDLSNVDPTEVAIADIDSDGYPDLIVGTGINELDIYYNGGDPPGSIGYGNIPASPTQVPTSAAAGFPITIKVADLDGNGLDDVVFGGFTSGTAGILFQTSPRVFTCVPIAVGGEPVQIAIGDLNGDGLVDIALPWANDNVLAIYYQNPNKTGPSDTFLGPATFPTSSGPFGCAVMDVNGDGKLDVVVACRAANSLNVFIQR